ncbi:histidine kinase dimerization/phosphoacceptor domain -containing protein [Bartonella ancashensis]|nr:histidine kinase dimerization/phosphoacceptor domain -containing protein [Bartonella ancashensis]
MVKKTNSFSVISSFLKLVQICWLRGGIVISLLMAFLALCCIILSSYNVDRELAQLDARSKLHEQVDLILLNLTNMAVADRRYENSRDINDKLHFTKSVGELDDLLEYAGIIVHSHPRWLEWFIDFKKEIEVRKSIINAHMVALDSFPDPSVHPPLPIEMTQFHVGHLSQLIIQFLDGDDPFREEKREAIVKQDIILTLVSLIAVVGSVTFFCWVIRCLSRDIHLSKMHQQTLQSVNSSLKARVKKQTKKLLNIRKRRKEDHQYVEKLLQNIKCHIDNFLNIVASLFPLQCNNHHEDDECSVIDTAHDFIQTISTVYHYLPLTYDTGMIPLADFLGSVVHDIKLSMPVELYDKVAIKTVFAECSLPEKDATVVGIIVVALLKHSFKNVYLDQHSTHIHVALEAQHDSRVALIFADNWAGMSGQNYEQRENRSRLFIESLCARFDKKPLFEDSASRNIKVIIPLQTIP